MFKTAHRTKKSLDDGIKSLFMAIGTVARMVMCVSRKKS